MPFTAFARQAAALRVGPGFGPLISEGAFAKSIEHVEDAVAFGARLVTGGGHDSRGGLVFAPTLLADVTPEMKIMRKATFDPAPRNLHMLNGEMIEVAGVLHMTECREQRLTFYAARVRRRLRAMGADDFCIEFKRVDLVNCDGFHQYMTVMFQLDDLSRSSMWIAHPAIVPAINAASVSGGRSD